MTETALEIKINKTANSRLPGTDFDNLLFGRVFSDHMFVADYRDGKWTDARVEPFGPMAMSPANATLHYAQSVFEGLKGYPSPDGKKVLIFRPDKNFERLNISAGRMCIPSVPEELFMQGLDTLVGLDRGWVPPGADSSLYIRPFIFATDEYMGIKPSETYRFVILTCPVGAYYANPVKVKIETTYTRAAEGGTGYAKAAGNYAASLFPARLAQQQGYDQLIWTDGQSHEFVEEAGTMNVMFVINDTLITAATGDTILSGITRQTILDLAKEMGVKTDVRRVSVKEIVRAAKDGKLQECFGAGTAATVAPISHISHLGKEYVMPERNENSLSSRLLKELETIRRGHKADTHGWVRSV